MLCAPVKSPVFRVWSVQYEVDGLLYDFSSLPVPCKPAFVVFHLVDKPPAIDDGYHLYAAKIELTVGITLTSEGMFFHQLFRCDVQGLGGRHLLVEVDDLAQIHEP